MKRPFLLLPLGLLAGCLTFGMAHWWTTREPRALAREPRSELGWLRREFHLDDDRFARVVALHEAYRPTCAELCRRIADQNRRLEETALASSSMDTNLAALVSETGRVRDDCRRAMLAHLYSVAAEMPPAQGRRYLELMLSRTCVLQPTHNVGDAHAHAHAHHGTPPAP